MHVSDKTLKEMAAEAGVVVVRVTRCVSSNHAKVFCEHHGYVFHVLVSAHPNGRDKRWRLNTMADFRKARKAVEQQDPALMKKYLGLRSATSTGTSKNK